MMKIQTISVKWMMFGCLFCLMICLSTCDTSCKMVRQNGKIGLEEDWSKSDILPFESNIENCEDVCLKNQSCVALHHTHYVCYTYYELGTIEDYGDSVFSEKNCSNTPPSTTEDPTTTTTMAPGMGTTMESTTANNSGEHVVKLNILSIMIMICSFIIHAE